MENIKSIIERYKHIRSLKLLGLHYQHKYAFIGIGSHSTANLYPVLDYLHVPLKYICCKSKDKLPLIEAARPGVKATTSVDEILSDDAVKGVFVSATPSAHFSIASEVIKHCKALFIEKPPCQSKDELQRLIAMSKSAGTSTVVVDLQKRRAPAMQILKSELGKCGNGIGYNLRYLTGAYPEGEALLDLFIHPLDCVTLLFGSAKVKWVERVDGHTLYVMLCHTKAKGVLELSTGYSWNNAKESITVNTRKGVYELQQMDHLVFTPKQRTLMGIPLEKVFRHDEVTTRLYGRNEFVPTSANNQIVTQGYFDTIKHFVDAVEGRKTDSLQSLESLMDTYSLMEEIRLACKQ